jgi:hypothetical protein
MAPLPLVLLLLLALKRRCFLFQLAQITLPPLLDDMGEIHCSGVQHKEQTQQLIPIWVPSDPREAKGTQTPLPHWIGAPFVAGAP